MPKTATKPPKKSTPRTATFNKVITRPDTYDIPDGTGKKVKRELNAEELRKVAENINAQIEAGHKIPAPFKHYVKDGDKNKLFLQDVLLDGSPVDRFMFDPSINAGYWKKAQFVDDCSKIDPSFEAGPGLVGTIEAPGDPNDPNTPAGKIGTTVQDTSIAILPKYKDGKGREWDNFVAHIALPVHPIEPAQDNFALAMSEEEFPLIITMSDSSKDSTGTPTRDPSGESAPSLQPTDASASGDPEGEQEFAEVCTLLRSVVQVDLPPSTTPDNLVQVLAICLRQKQADTRATEASNPITTQPPGSQHRPAPVAMSESDPSSSSADDSTQEEIMSEDNKLVAALVKREIKNKKAELHGRVRKLVNSGAFEQQYANDNFLPEIEALTMSAEDIGEDGEFPTPFIEKRIKDAEQQAARMSTLIMSAIEEGRDFGNLPEGANVQEPPAFGEAPPIDDTRATDILNRNFPALAAIG